MKYSLTIRKEAELDISESFKFYEEHRLGLGHDFLLCVDAAISKIDVIHYFTKKFTKISDELQLNVCHIESFILFNLNTL